MKIQWLVLRRVQALAFGVALAVGSVDAHAAYSFTTLDPPGSTGAQVWAINGSGIVVGSAFTATSSSSFSYSAGVFTPIAGPADAISASVLGISDAGVVVGSYYTSTTIDPDGNVVPGPTSGFIKDGSGFSAINVPGANFVQARAISPDGRYVSGYYSDNTQYSGFVLDRTTSTLTTITSGTNLVIAQGINQSNIVVGSRFLTGTPTRRVGFTYDIATGTLTDFQLPGATATSFRAINASGQLGGFFSASGVTHGFVGSPTAFEVIDVPGAAATFVQGMDNLGNLVGSYNDADGNSHGFLASLVPEPATWLLFTMGVLLWIGMRMRRH